MVPTNRRLMWHGMLLALPHDDQRPRHAFRTKTELSKNDFQRICG